MSDWPTCCKCGERPVRAWKNDPTKHIKDGCCYECSWEFEYDRREQQQRLEKLAELVDLTSRQCVNGCGRLAGFTSGSEEKLRWLFCCISCREAYLAPLVERERELKARQADLWRAVQEVSDLRRAFTLPVPITVGAEQ